MFHPQQELLSGGESPCVSSGPTTDSSHAPRRLAASFQIHPQPMFLTVMALPRQFFAQDVQFVQYSLRVMTAGPTSGSSQTLNGQTSRQRPHRLHRSGLYIMSRPVSSTATSSTSVTSYHQPMITTTIANTMMKAVPIFSVCIIYGYSLLITLGSLTDVIPDQSIVRDIASMN